MDDWDYAHCLPYFKRMETCLAGADDYRGGDGPLVLERGPAENPLFGAFLEAVQQAGYPLTDDVNGYRQEGSPPSTARSTAAAASVRRAPTSTRRWIAPNLEVRTAHVREAGRSSTALARSGSSWRGGDTVRAAEVILCGGAINSPQLLQLSGVGNAQELGGLGVDVVHDLPGVGENLQDHLEVYVQYASKQPVSVAPALKYRNRPAVGFRWLFFRSGPGATNHFEAGGFVRSNDEVAYPNLMFHFLPVAIRYDGSQPAGGGSHGYQVHVGPMYSDARGSVKITSTDRGGAPGASLQLPLDRPGPAGVGGGGALRTARSSRSPRSTSSTAARPRPARPSRPTRRSSTGSRATPRRRCTRPAPAGWASTSCPSSTRPRCGCTASRACASSTRP